MTSEVDESGKNVVKKKAFRNIIEDYYTLIYEIKKLGPVSRLREFKKPFALFIVSLICLFISLGFTVFAQSLLSSLSHPYKVAIVCALLFIVFLVWFVKTIENEYYIGVKKENANRRSKIIDYSIRYYFVHDDTLKISDEVKDIKDEGLDKVLDKLNDEVILSKIRESENSEQAYVQLISDLEYLISKFKSDLSQLEDKIKRSILIAFTVTLSTAGVAIVNSIISILLWKYQYQNELKINEAIVSLSGNTISFVVLFILVLFMINMKSTFDVSRRDKSLNLEYSIQSLNRIKMAVERLDKTNTVSSIAVSAKEP